MQLNLQNCSIYPFITVSFLIMFFPPDICFSAFSSPFLSIYSVIDANSSVVEVRKAVAIFSTLVSTCTLYRYSP